MSMIHTPNTPAPVGQTGSEDPQPKPEGHRRRGKKETHTHQHNTTQQHNTHGEGKGGTAEQGTHPSLGSEPPTSLEINSCSKSEKTFIGVTSLSPTPLKTITRSPVNI